MANARLGPNNRVFMNRKVTGRASLTRHDDVLLENGASGKPGLAANDVVFPNDAGMSNLDQTVNFRAALDTRFAQGRPIDRSECLNFYVVFENGNARLDDFVL